MSKKLSTLGVGTTFEVPVKSAYRSFLGDYVVFKMADKNHSGYPSGAITMITDKIIALLCSDAKEPSNGNSDRRNYGNNRHIHSNILQWLNSNAAAGKWYSAKHGQDAPPSSANVWDNVNPYDTWAGFLAMLDDDFVAALMTTTLTVAKNTVTDGGSYETFTAKMFLASTTEVGLANENGIAEGSKLALFSDNTSRLAYCTQAAIDKSNYSSDPTTSQAWYWWLRTPHSGDSCYVRYVHSSGALNNSSAYGGHRGVRPLCNLKSDILVSDNKNSRGNYEFQWNAAPSTPDGISVPESCYSTQNITVTWGASTDPDSDTITYVLERSVNNGSYTQATATDARTFTETVSTSWNTIKCRVKARDAYGNESAYVTSSAVPVVHNQPPAISGQNADLGTKSGDFSYKYTVTDPDNDKVTVVEKVNETTLRSYTPTLGEENTMNVAGHDFTALSNGAHADLHKADQRFCYHTGRAAGSGGTAHARKCESNAGNSSGRNLQSGGNEQSV